MDGGPILNAAPSSAKTGPWYATTEYLPNVSCFLVELVATGCIFRPVFVEILVLVNNIVPSHLTWPSSLFSMTTTSNLSSCRPLEK